MMDALDEVRATEQARRMLLRHERLRRVRGAAAANEKTGSHRPESEGLSDGTD
jgi:hypothetical protein